MTVEERIAALERRVAELERTKDEVRARRFVVVDKSDRILATLASEETVDFERVGRESRSIHRPDRPAGELRIFGPDGESWIARIGATAFGYGGRLEACTPQYPFRQAQIGLWCDKEDG